MTLYLWFNHEVRETAPGFNEFGPDFSDRTVTTGVADIPSIRCGLIQNMSIINSISSHFIETPKKQMHAK